MNHNTMKLLGAAAVVLGVAALPGRAVAAQGQPEKLSDAQLDDVTAGDMESPAFVLAAHHGREMEHHGEEMRHHGNQGVTNIGTQVNFTIKDVNLIFNVGSNTDFNLAAALQLSFFSQQPQAASATAVQSAAHGH